MKSRMFSLIAALLLFAGCGSLSPPSAPEPHAEQKNEPTAAQIPKDSCHSVYASILALGPHSMTVQAGDRTLLLTSEELPRAGWHKDDLVVLYFTGEFGDGMQVRYMEQRPAPVLPEADS